MLGICYITMLQKRRDAGRFGHSKGVVVSVVAILATITIERLFKWSVQRHNTTAMIDKPPEAYEQTRVPDVLVLCTPWGGLTNLKQRIQDCMYKQREKFANESTTVGFLLPWLMATPKKGPFIPFEYVFDVTAWVKWTRSNDFTAFIDQAVEWRGEISDGLWKSVNDYESQVRNWISGGGNATSRRNITLIRDIGDLTELDVDFGVDAFLVRKVLTPANTEDLDLNCVVHARIEQDWKDFAGGNEDIFTPLDSIFEAVKRSGLCERIAILTGNIDAAASLCQNDTYCATFNNSALE